MEFTNFLGFLKQFGGPILALLGASLAALMAGIGSARGVGLVGEVSAGLITEQPEKFVKTLILEAIPGTQGFYGFITGLFILQKIGAFSSTGIKALTLAQGFLILMAAIPVAFVEYRSAISQGKTAAAAIQIVAKRPEKFFDGVIYAVMVETYAVLALIISLVMISKIQL